ncbi:helix-turn-helix domain-containing protein [Rhodococcus globerulus]|uniref:helix-turn-helix domain-containing protein n=1 Tax=Rhodococcus globerulus TaxID=33008 RepID=UPI0035306291
MLVTVDRIQLAGAGLWSITEDIDTTDRGTGVPLLAIVAVLKDCQHAINCENARIGLAAARERGRCPGRPRVLTGTTVAQARTMKNDGATVTEIAQALGVRRTTLYRYL